MAKDALVPLVTFGLQRLIDAGLAKASMPKPVSRAEQLDRRIKQIEELIANQRQTSHAPAGVPQPASRRPATGDAAVATGCIPCARAHLATVSGTLKEALRFAREGGILDPEVQSRLTAAEEDITNIERHDWTPEKILASPPEEAELIRSFLPRLRELRQEVVQIASVEDLEQAAAKAGELATDFRLAVLKLRGIDTGRIIDLAKKVEAGEMTIEQAKEELQGQVST